MNPRDSRSAGRLFAAAGRVLVIGLLPAVAWSAQSGGGQAARPQTGKPAPITRDAAVASITDRFAAGDIPGSLAVYDRYVAGAGRDDLEMLAPIAWAVVDRVARDPASMARIVALDRLAAAGDARARAQLEADAGGSRTLTPESLNADAVLAKLGDAKAVARLNERLTSEAFRDKGGIIEALVDARAKSSAYLLAALLADPNPVNRMFAARGLCPLGSRDSLAPLTQAYAAETEGPTRAMLAYAVGCLGGREADAQLLKMEASPAADVRVMTAEAYKMSGNARWRTLARALLRDPNDGPRLKAASLLADVDPAARAVLEKGAADANPATREVAIRFLEKLPPPSLALMRRLLEDPSPLVRASAGGAIMDAHRQERQRR